MLMMNIDLSDYTELGRLAVLRKKSDLYAHLIY